MEDLLQDLIAYAIEKKASDIHFVMQNQKLQIKLRTQNDMLDVYQDIWQPAFFEYLKFISRMDLTSHMFHRVANSKFYFIITKSFVVSVC